MVTFYFGENAAISFKSTETQDHLFFQLTQMIRKLGATVNIGLLMCPKPL